MKRMGALLAAIVLCAASAGDAVDLKKGKFHGEVVAIDVAAQTMTATNAKGESATFKVAGHTEFVVAGKTTKAVLAYVENGSTVAVKYEEVGDGLTATFVSIAKLKPAALLHEGNRAYRDELLDALTRTSAELTKRKDALATELSQARGQLKDNKGKLRGTPADTSRYEWRRWPPTTGNGILGGPKPTREELKNSPHGHGGITEAIKSNEFDVVRVADESAKLAALTQRFLLERAKLAQMVDQAYQRNLQAIDASVIDNVDGLAQVWQPVSDRIYLVYGMAEPDENGPKEIRKTGPHGKKRKR